MKKILMFCGILCFPLFTYANTWTATALNNTNKSVLIRYSADSIPPTLRVFMNDQAPVNFSIDGIIQTTGDIKIEVCQEVKKGQPQICVRWAPTSIQQPLQLCLPGSVYKCVLSCYNKDPNNNASNTTCTLYNLPAKTAYSGR